MKPLTNSIKKILRYFREEYCVMRFGGDVDILVRSENIDYFNDVLVLNGFTRTKINPYSMHRVYEKGSINLHFHIDGVTGRHTKYLEPDGILERRQEKDGVYYAAPEDEFMVVMMHSILDKRSGINDKYIRILNELIPKMKKRLGKNFHATVLELVITSLNWAVEYTDGSRIIDTIVHSTYQGRIDTENRKIINNLVPKVRRIFERKRFFKIMKVYVFGTLWWVTH